ncbi:MAG: response regulator transcription factor [Cyanobacteriota/Melainabacteria group bacterium]|nr:response regulator transcription factor [Cyanobacteria bacterium HKST-UBA01]MCB9470243.1 response regulator transcription factor [Candidatus Obscuribacterales bacterium]
MPKLLIVEDEVDLADQLRDWFLREKYVVDLVHDGNQALDSLEAFQYDVIILDWMIPGPDGITILKRFRQGGGKTPVVMLSARSRLEDLEVGLDTGSDYYVRKPVSLRELSASVRAAVRRGESRSPGAVIELGNMILDATARTFYIDGNAVHLEPREFNLLEFLLRHPNQVFAYDALIDRVWPSDSLISREAVRTYIKALRKKMNSSARDSIIKNIRGYGYKLEIDE